MYLNKNQGPRLDFFPGNDCRVIVYSMESLVAGEYNLKGHKVSILAGEATIGVNADQHLNAGSLFWPGLRLHKAQSRQRLCRPSPARAHGVESSVLERHLHRKQKY